MSGHTERPYGSLLLGPLHQSPRALRIRVQLLLTVVLLTTHVVGSGVVVALTAWVLPQPTTSRSMGIALAISVPTYVLMALIVGAVIGTSLTMRTLRWSLRGEEPDARDRRRALEVPLRLTVMQTLLWAGATVLFVLLAVIFQPDRAVGIGLTVGLAGVVVCAVAYLLTEFVLRPISAQALSDDVRRHPRGLGVGGRMVTFWLLGTGAPVVGLVIAAILALTGSDTSKTRLAVEVVVLGCIVLVFGLLVTLLNARSVVAPVESVRGALLRVEQGDLDQRVSVYDATELGLLQAGFNRMAVGLQEREHLRDLFGRHVGQDVARAAATGHLELGGELRVVSVLFVDVVGSTTIAAERGPTEVVDLLNDFFGVVVAEIERHGGLVNKFMGDAVLAIFGAPVDLPDHAGKALAAARAMAARLAAEHPQVQAGIGVFTGETVAGNVGTSSRLEYTVIGDAVNAAARLTELAKDTPGRILSARESLDAAGPGEARHWREGDTVTLRGRTAPTVLVVTDPRP
ncbi:MAG: HAMP domain-containing protein [Actinobacteria bacterium]|uniref:Unannotated protein n=1 Tax=freshwater metagenome TaxID=449393 RepID=A0A6J6PT64_9ZZZZ|nr:HAMP domain-containing protein [Actinomycetota bacterium]